MSMRAVVAALLVIALAAPAGAETGQRAGHSSGSSSRLSAVQPSPQAAPQSSEDAALEARVESALEAAADLPADSITVQARGGVITLTGSVVCEPCGGNATPGGAGTVQQSLGAVVRAVPGVERVEFRLRYGPA
jgi:osmotically-inducible protein OsmY